MRDATNSSQRPERAIGVSKNGKMPLHVRTAGALLAAGVFGAMVCACSSAELPEASDVVQVAPKCADASDLRYFPINLFRSFPETYAPRDWMAAPSQILAAMREPPLWCGVEPPSYRMLWLTSLSGWPRDRSNWPPTMIRFSQRNGTWSMTAVQLASFFNRTEIARHERSLSMDEAGGMLAAVSEFGFWRREDFSYDAGSFDGALWIIEGRRDTTYHPVFLANSDEDAVRRLASVFLQLAGIDRRLLRGE